MLEYVYAYMRYAVCIPICVRICSYDDHEVLTLLILLTDASTSLSSILYGKQGNTLDFSMHNTKNFQVKDW